MTKPTIARMNEGIWVDIDPKCSLEHFTPFGRDKQRDDYSPDYAHPDGCRYFEVPYHKPTVEGLTVERFVARLGEQYEHQVRVTSETRWIPGLPEQKAVLLELNRESIEFDILAALELVQYPGVEDPHIRKVAVARDLDWERARPVVELCALYEIEVV